MNCLEYALCFWVLNKDYSIYYNGDHVVNLPKGTELIGFEEITKAHNCEQLIKLFSLSKWHSGILFEYFKTAKQ